MTHANQNFQKRTPEIPIIEPNAMSPELFSLGPLALPLTYFSLPSLDWGSLDLIAHSSITSIEVSARNFLTLVKTTRAAYAAKTIRPGPKET